MRIVELFGGIGSCTTALINIGIEVDVVDYVEIDKYAVASYNAINGTNFECQDINDYDKELDDIDLIMHGSPCVDYSIAGRGAGGTEGSGTRSSLMWHTVRIVKGLKPRYVVWENVRNVLSKRHISNFTKYLNEMEKLGYKNYYKVLNTKDFGIPHNRERIFVVSILNGNGFTFPTGIPLQYRLKDFMDIEVDRKYYLSDRMLDYIKNKQGKKYNFRVAINDPNDILVSPLRAQGDYPVVDAKPEVLCGIGDMDSNSGTQWKQQNRIYDADKVSISICSTFNPYYKRDNTIRRLTPAECWRLQGFTDEQFAKARAVNSDTQLYKQAGNTITVSVLEAIFQNLFDDEHHEETYEQMSIFDL